MSFSSIRSIATSALTSAQVQMSVTSANIANASTDGYTRKTADTVATVSTASSGAGVAVTGISSTVDRYLLQSLVASASEVGATSTAATYTDYLQSLMGETSGSDDGGTSIATLITSLQTALTDLSSMPDSTTMQASVVDALDSIANELRQTSASIQSLRAEADDAIEDSVDTINTTLHTIDDLNDQITAATARGDSTADLEDQRNTAIQTLAGLMNVSYYVNTNNQMVISTSSGQSLLGSTVHEVSYTAASSVTDETVFSAITVDGKDITSSITSGTVGALLKQRDEVLPAAQDELDELASTLIASYNAISNAATSLPAPSELTGTTTVSGSDALGGSGTVRIAVVDDDGTLQSYTDFDLSSYASVDDLVAAIDAMDGVSASLGGDGTLTVASESGAGITIGSLDSNIAGQGFSDYFGLNDILTGSDASDIRIRSDIEDDASLLPTYQLSEDQGLTVGDTVVANGSSAIADRYLTALTDKTSFDAAGEIGATSKSFADYAAEIVSVIATNASNASTAATTAETTQATLADSFSSKSGVNVDEETAALSALEDYYAASAQILSTLNAMFEALLDVAKSA